MEIKREDKKARLQAPPAGYSKRAAKKKKKEEARERMAKPVSLGAILCVLLVLIIVSVSALIYFDLLGVKDFVISVFGLDMPSNKYLAQLSSQEAALIRLNDEMELKTADLEKREKEILKREENAAKLEEELSQRQEALSQMQELVEGLKTDIDYLALTIEKMAPAKAAEMLSNLYNVTDIARILVKMKNDAAAKILDNMAPDRAAAIIAEMMRYT